MNAKQYLNQLRTIEAVIRARKGQLERLRKEQTFLPGIAYDTERVQTSANPDPDALQLYVGYSPAWRSVTEFRTDERRRKNG